MRDTATIISDDERHREPTAVTNGTPATTSPSTATTTVPPANSTA